LGGKTLLSEIHFLLTYNCNFECDHCFLYCGPTAAGTFTISQVDQVLQEALKIGTVNMVYFEGGEPTLYYPLLLESVKRAQQYGLKVGIVSNAYGALTEEDARLWLEPLVEAGLNVLSVSDDQFHYGDDKETPASIARKVGDQLGMTAFPICIDPPEILETAEGEKGASLIGGGAKFRGRAADTLTEGLPTRPWNEFLECPYEDLVNPSRVHVDPFGNVHICQGISIGNFWKDPLSKIMAEYVPDQHPICGPLNRKGPAGLIEELGLAPQATYVDECHACFSLRRELLESYPEHLAPRLVYGF
jgi:MoaA/NifB/PqqE/SkfB family radical SAM enzyme